MPPKKYVSSKPKLAVPKKSASAGRMTSAYRKGYNANLSYEAARTRHPISSHQSFVQQHYSSMMNANNGGNSGMPFISYDSPQTFDNGSLLSNQTKFLSMALHEYSNRGNGGSSDIPFGQTRPSNYYKNDDSEEDDDINYENSHDNFHDTEREKDIFVPKQYDTDKSMSTLFPTMAKSKLSDSDSSNYLNKIIDSDVKKYKLELTEKKTKNQLLIEQLRDIETINQIEHIDYEIFEITEFADIDTELHKDILKSQIELVDKENIRLSSIIKIFN